MEKIYKLKKDYSHLIDMTYDISLFPFDGSKSLKYKVRLGQELELTNKLNFLANFSTIDTKTEVPINIEDLPVFSDQFLSVIETVGKLNVKRYEVVLVSDSYFGERFDGEGNVLKDVPVKNNYQMVQMLDIINGLDYDKSIYEPMNEWENFPTVITKFIVKEPEGGFPTFFRISEEPSSFFVSQQIKEALESNNIKGCFFEEVEVTTFTS